MPAEAGQGVGGLRSGGSEVWEATHHGGDVGGMWGAGKCWVLICSLGKDHSGCWTERSPLGGGDKNGSRETVSKLLQLVRWLRPGLPTMEEGCGLTEGAPSGEPVPMGMCWATGSGPLLGALGAVIGYP